jgi:hypothetical protein
MGELGAGGMGAVYRATDGASGRVVALKQLTREKAGAKRDMLEALFEREYHTLIRLKHPRIIEVYDYGLTEQGPYYTMELLDGADLQQLAPLPFREACRHLRDVASSLALMHSHRLLHRDVTPRNVRLTTDGRAKLIDFGALCSVGAAAEVVGTPPCIAPEVLRRLPLDQRTDLFALGAAAYWALTGRHAYPARRARELWELWQSPPLPPSQIVDGIPKELDALVLSLLSIDPLARPASAAQVIDALTVIAALSPEEHEQTGESYLSSGPLVGRSDELRWLEQRIARAFAGRGTQSVIEGASGIGKTRLLQEAGVQAQLRGAVVLRADAQASSRPFGVVAALAAQLLDALGEVARGAAGASLPLLAHLSIDRAPSSESVFADALPDDPGERRARLQTALHDWFVGVARQRTLLVVVDNLQAADDNSAAFLAALGHEAHTAQLAVVVALRLGEEVTAPTPVRALRKQGASLKLGGLDLPECEELVAALFGHAANSGRLARLLFEKSAGNPQRCMDLAQLTVKRGLVKYVGGSWVLPMEVADDELPSRVEDLIRAKLTALSAHARRLCEALSVHARHVPIERCLGLCEGMAERDVYLALDELVAEQILAVDDGSYGFRQQAVRESVLAQLGDTRRCALSLQAATAVLAQREPTVQSRVDAAWHLLNAGEEERGADLMTAAAREFLQHQGVEDVEQVVRAIETALSLYEKQGRSKYEIARLLFPLMSLAFFVDWRVTLKHGERAIDLGLDITGLGLAGRLSRFLPGKLALAIGLLTGFVRFGWQQVRGLKYGLIEAIEGFCGLIPAAIGTQNIVFDLPAVKRYAQKLRPLALFGAGHIASLMYDFAWSQYLMSYGREDEARDVLEKLRREFPDPAVQKALGEAHWKAMFGGILFSLGILYPYEFGARALEAAQAMESLGVRVWSMAAEEVRMLYHAFRGETEEVQRYRERVELFAVQGSTTWQAEIFWPILLMDSEVRCGHALGLRTIREQLARRSKDHPSLRVYADLAQATYAMLRGEHAAAVELYERVVAELRTQDEATSWQAFRATFGYTAALNALGEHARAKQHASELLARAGAQAERVVGHYQESQRQLALAEAGLGNQARAVELLDGLLARHGAEDQPMLIGLLHEARAEVALKMSDLAAFELHFGETERRYRAAKNPSLIARAERLSAAAVSAGVRARSAVSLAEGLAQGSAARGATRRALAQLASCENRCDEALRLILQESGARSGQLFVLVNDELDLAATSTGAAPPPAERERLLHEVLRARRAADDDDSETVAMPTSGGARDPARSVFVDSELGTAAGVGEPGGHRALVLCSHRSGRTRVVGGALVEVDPERPFTLDVELLEPIASALSYREDSPTTAHRPQR